MMFLQWSSGAFSFPPIAYWGGPLERKANNNVHHTNLGHPPNPIPFFM